MSFIISSFNDTDRERAARRLRISLSQRFADSLILTEKSDMSELYQCFDLVVVSDFFKKMSPGVDRINLIRSLSYEYLSYTQVDMIASINCYTYREWNDREKALKEGNFVRGIK